MEFKTCDYGTVSEGAGGGEFACKVMAARIMKLLYRYSNMQYNYALAILLIHELRG